jgi:hypothetical protein
LPRIAALLAQPVSLGDVGEWEGQRDWQGEAPRLDQLADLAEHVERAAGTPLLKPHPMLDGSAKSATVMTRAARPTRN